MTIKAGSTVSIPKGVLVLDGPGGEYADQAEKGLSKRATKATLTSVDDWSRKWYKLLDEDDQKRVQAVYQGYWVNAFEGDRYAFDYMSLSRPQVRSQALTDLIAELKAKCDALYGDYVFGSWSNDKKHALVSTMVATETKPKVAKEQTITKRRQMVPESVWSFTKDVEINLWVSNPQIDLLVRERESYRVDPHSRHQRGGTMVVVLGGGREQTQQELDAMARIQKQIDNTPKQIKVLVGLIGAGTRVRVRDKLSSEMSDGNGLMVPVEIIGDKKISVTEGYSKPSWNNPLINRAYGLRLPYKLIEDAVEAESVPESIVWVLRDTSTGEYFGGWQTERSRGYDRSTNTPKMSTTFSGSKKYATLSALKASIMDFTGYHAGMDNLDTEGYRPEWVGGDTKKIDLPETWEAVAVDKTTNTPKRTEDVQNWFANLMRLRVLTLQFGSVVRSLYKKVEGKDQYSAIVLFTLHRDIDQDDPAIIREFNLIEAAVAASGAENTKRDVNERSMAYAVESATDATMIMLGFEGTSTVKAFEITDLKEIVPSMEAANG